MATGEIFIEPTGVLDEGDVEIINAEPVNFKPLPPSPEHKIRYIWKNVLLYIILHIGALYGLYLALTSAKLATVIFGK